MGKELSEAEKAVAALLREQGHDRAATAVEQQRDPANGRDRAKIAKAADGLTAWE